MKIPSKNFKGIAYIQLSDLPIVQQQLVLQSLHKDLFIKILIGEKIVSNCLQYSDYERWYSNVFNMEEGITSVDRLVQSETIDAK